jgi:cellulose synthase/poly-beta-1,6-N-acetylglucosamine synthase-like glycosyltransferase
MIIIMGLCLMLIVYVYAGYPALLLILKRFKTKPVLTDPDFRPTVTMVISCYNEIDVIDEKIRNALAIDYPRELIEFLVVSDGSTDGTDEAVLAVNDSRVRLIRQEGRLGKTSAINMAMKTISSDVVVFSDANAMYRTDAVSQLVKNFADPEVGYVVGAALYRNAEESSASESENSYWNYELAIKKAESDICSVVGGDGAIYAIRRPLYKPLEQDDINDFVNPLQIIMQGYRGVFDPAAICDEDAAGSFEKEAKRKQRIVNRSFNGLMKCKALLNPCRYGFYSIQLISHKLLRWLIPLFLATFLFTSILHYFFGEAGAATTLILFGEAVFILLASIGHAKRRQQAMPRYIFYPYYFVLVNYYALVGVCKALLGDVQITWSSPRHSEVQRNVWLQDAVGWIGILAASLMLLSILI